MEFTEQFDVVVVGAGHAGCEAAMAAARMGLKTALFTLNVDLIAQMSCNPAVGGIAKGHLVREVDALGGIMGEVTDAVGIQFRLLNTSRGPAVWSPRAQCDKQAYRLKMREVLESQSNLKIKQAEVADLIIEESSIGGSSSGNSVSVCHSEEHSDEESAFINASPPTTNGQRRLLGIRLRDGRTVGAQAVIITTGTFLNGLIHCGEQQYPAGRSGEPPAVLLGEALKQLGLRGCRLKTGTPPRLDGRTIDWSRFQMQPGDPDPTPFSFRTKRVAHHESQVPCYIAFTTAETHRIIRENVHRSPMYSGQIKSIGPRYCPSIEDKIVKFPDKTTHQLFLEPEGLNTHEIYVNGMRTSLAVEVHPAILIDDLIAKGTNEPYRMFTSRAEFRLHLRIDNADRRLTPYGRRVDLISDAAWADFLAKQQRLEALKQLLEKTKLTSTMLDGVANSLSDLAMSDVATGDSSVQAESGSADDAGAAIARVETASLSSPVEPSSADSGGPGFGRAEGDAANGPLSAAELSFSTAAGQTCVQLLKRPEITIEHLVPILRELYPAFFVRDAYSVSSGGFISSEIRNELKSVETEIKYQGYLQQQQRAIERLKKAEQRTIPEWFDYRSVSGLSREMKETLVKIRPHTLGHASRIPGVTPAAVSLVNVYIEIQARRREQAATI